MASKITKYLLNPFLIVKYVWENTFVRCARWSYDTLSASFLKGKVRDENVSLFSSDCSGGVLLHHLGMRFNSPTVNLFFPSMDEYLNYVEHLKDFSSLPVAEHPCDKPYPCGTLTHEKFGTVHLHFMHYHSFAEAAETWRRRTERINFDNVRILMTLKTPDVSLVKRLANIGLPAAVITFPDVYPQIKDACEGLPLTISVIRWNGPTAAGEFINRYGIFGRRPVYDFDAAAFLNKPYSNTRGA